MQRTLETAHLSIGEGLFTITKTRENDTAPLQLSDAGPGLCLDES